jgi:hypothetical protein
MEKNIQKLNDATVPCSPTYLNILRNFSDVVGVKKEENSLHCIYNKA